MNTPPKSIFKSKSAMAGALTAIAGAVGTFVPDVGQILSTHAPAIMFWSGTLAFFLRRVTNGRVVLFANE